MEYGRSDSGRTCGVRHRG